MAAGDSADRISHTDDGKTERKGCGDEIAAGECRNAASDEDERERADKLGECFFEHFFIPPKKIFFIIALSVDVTTGKVIYCFIVSAVLLITDVDRSAFGVGKSIRDICVKRTAGSRPVNDYIDRSPTPPLRAEDLLTRAACKGDRSLNDQGNVHGVRCLNAEKASPILRRKSYVFEFDIDIGGFNACIILINTDYIVASANILIRIK